MKKINRLLADLGIKDVYSIEKHPDTVQDVQNHHLIFIFVDSMGKASF